MRCSLNSSQLFVAAILVVSSKFVEGFATVRSVHSFSAQKHNAVLPVKLSTRNSGPFKHSSLSMTAASSSSKVDSVLNCLDKVVLNRVVRICHHIPALASLGYFGLISMSSMMKTSPPMVPTLASVLSRPVGSTTNAAFAALFPTFVTPASFVFLIWPFISVLQLVVIAYSALKPGDATMDQSDLTALSMANVASTMWLVISSTATVETGLPLGSFLALPLVPYLAGYPVRKSKPGQSAFLRLAFLVYSSFTTVASFLAFAVELQHGGRIPFFGGKPELCATAFLALTSYVVFLPKRTPVKKCVNLLALSGILVRRITTGAVLQSPSFWGTVAVTFWAFMKLFSSEGKSEN